jgi:hypothetical protein
LRARRCGRLSRIDLGKLRKRLADDFGLPFHGDTLPGDCAFHDDLWANFDDDASISQWSRGFSAETWEGYLFGELADECSATLMVLSFFSSQQLAQAYFEESAPRENGDRETTFEEFAGAVRDLFPDSLASYPTWGGQSSRPWRNAARATTRARPEHQGRTQCALPVRQRQEVQEMLR